MRKYVAEAIGAFAIVFCGTGAIVVNEASSGQISHAGVACVVGLVVLAMIYAFGEVSGAHFNPAVSIAFWAMRVFPGRAVLPYVFSQLAGAIIASLALRALFPSSVLLGATLPSGEPWRSFVLEIILTFLLMIVIMSVSKGARETGWPENPRPGAFRAACGEGRAVDTDRARSPCDTDARSRGRVTAQRQPTRGIAGSIRPPTGLQQ